MLRAQTVASARTLEQKISDAGPNPLRIDPHILTTQRNKLVEERVITRRPSKNTPWYHLATTSADDVKNRLAVLEPIHQALQQPDRGKRIGQALEIAIYRALLQQSTMTTFGAYFDLNAHDDATLYRKEDPPSTIHGRTHRGKLDFVVVAPGAGLAAIEAKNIREWLYPQQDEIPDLLGKACDLDAVPVLIARRVPYVTFKLLLPCGVVIHQTYNQRLPAADQALADKARHKDLLGFHDIRLSRDSLIVTQMAALIRAAEVPHREVLLVAAGRLHVCHVQGNPA